jgi:hypothetical protein
LSVIAEGRARLSVQQSGRFGGMNLGHSWAPYVLGHVHRLLALVIPIYSRDLDAEYAMERLKLYPHQRHSLQQRDVQRRKQNLSRLLRRHIPSASEARSEHHKKSPEKRLAATAGSSGRTEQPFGARHCGSGAAVE